MSEFLKFAYELLSQVVYNIVSWVTAFLKLFFLGWIDYFTKNVCIHTFTVLVNA